MAISAKLIVAAALSGAAFIGGCAADPYYGNGYYGYDNGYPYGYAADPYYYGPSVGFGIAFSDQDAWNRDHGNRWRDRDGHWHDGGDRTYRGNWRGSPNAATTNDIRNNNGTPMWSQGDTYRGTGPNYDPQKDHGQYSPG